MKILSRQSASRAFTLLELLVVISIIAVLAGILLPVGQGVLDRAKKVDARVTMNSIITAVKSYQTEYGQYPVEPPTAASGAAAGTTSAADTTFDTGAGDPSSGKGGRNGLLFDVLRALNNPTGATTSGTSDAYKALNSRRIVYFESKDVKNPADPRGGFIPATTASVKPKTGFKTGDLVDPFGNLFCVRIDSNYTDAVMQPYKINGTLDSGLTYQYDTSDNDATPSAQLLRTAVACFSPGKDQVFGDASQNLTTSCDDIVSWQ